MTNRDLHELEALEALAPTDEELLAAAEAVGAGARIPFPQLLNRNAEDDQPERCHRHVIDHETASTVGGKLLAAKQALLDAAKALPLEHQIDLHLGFNGLLNEIDRLTGEVAERWGDE
jgi:hypothetical protein